MQNFPPHEQVALPYDFGALAPVISGKIMELHFTKHHAGYVKNLNSALEAYLDAERKHDLAAMIALEGAIRFNGGGHINHTIFWTNLAPEKNGGGGEPKGELAAQIKKQFGSFDELKKKFTAMTGAIQGSGWGWLGYSKEKMALELSTCANQDPLSTKGLIPLLGIDIWEHAYYIDYENRRPDYLANIWRVVNWTNVADRFANASKN